MKFICWLLRRHKFSYVYQVARIHRRGKTKRVSIFTCERCGKEKMAPIKKTQEFIKEETTWRH